MKKILYTSLSLLIFSFFTFIIFAATTTDKPLNKMFVEEIDQAIKKAQKDFPKINERLVYFTSKFLGTKYVLGPLGEGEKGKIDKDPLFNFEAVDCVTYIEQSLALAISKSYKEFLPNLNKIRYKDGKISYLTRNHYSVLDWLPNNKWLLEDVTEEIGSKNIKYVTRTIDKQKFFKQKGIDIAIDPITLTTNYVPKDKVKNIKDKLEEGLIIFHIGNKPGIFTLHWGVLIKQKEQPPNGATPSRFFIRHASSVHKKVVDEDFFKYLKEYKFIKGLKFLKVKTTKTKVRQ